MKRQDVQIPDHIWEQIRNQLSGIPGGPLQLVVNLKLRDGNHVKTMVLDARGRVLGKLVGGHDGISESPLGFTSDDIVAVRVVQGWLGGLGLTRWKK